MLHKNQSITISTAVSAVCLLAFRLPCSASEKPLEAGVSYMKVEEKVKQPEWLEGTAYSTKDLTMRVFRTFASGRIKSKIPSYTSSSVRLRPRVLSYWKGYKPGESCQVTCVPLKDGDNFKFHHSNPEGPRGYLQCIGRDKEGYMKYRIWFSGNESTES